MVSKKKPWKDDVVGRKFYTIVEEMKFFKDGQQYQDEITTYVVLCTGVAIDANLW